MSIKINLGAWNSIFAVPTAVVDEKLKFSDGVKLKVLLYILRHSGEELKEEEISAATGVNATDIPEAMDYWISMDILKNADSGFAVPSETRSETAAEAAELESEKKPVRVPPKPQKPDYVFVAQQLAQDGDFRILVNETQSALGKTVSNADAATLLMLKNTCGLPLDVIIMLIQYCISINRPNMRAVETIGVRWSDEGIFSVEAAEEKIRRAKQSSKNFSIVSSAFGLKNIGSPTKKQLEYGDKWVGEWGFSAQMLREAYERCVDKKNTLDLTYINGILRRWRTAGIFNVDDLKNEESRKKSSGYKKPSGNGRKSSYNIEELEKINTLDGF